MDPIEVERRGKCRRKIIPVDDVHFTVVKHRRCRSGSGIHNIIAISENDRIERSLQRHVIIAISQDDSGQAIASVNRNSDRGRGVATDDIAYPVQAKKCTRATDIVDSTEDRCGIERYDKIKIMMSRMIMVVMLITVMMLRMIKMMMLRMGEGCAN